MNDVKEIKVYICSISIYSAIFIIAALVYIQHCDCTRHPFDTHHTSIRIHINIPALIKITENPVNKCFIISTAWKWGEQI